MKFSDIKPFTRSANYRVNIPWGSVEETLEYYNDKMLPNFVFDMNPDFQRGHVWQESQQTRYVEYILKDGKSSRDIQWNCVGWQDSYKGPMVLVDGKQRLEAVRKFLRNELPVFGSNYYKDFTDRLSYSCDFVFHINNLSNRADVLQWYLDLNCGGTVHTFDELDKVRRLLQEEYKK